MEFYITGFAPLKDLKEYIEGTNNGIKNNSNAITYSYGLNIKPI